MNRSDQPAFVAPELLWLAGMLLPTAALVLTGSMSDPVPTTLDDFFGPGTQPLGLVEPIEDAGRCDSCHGGYDQVHEPYEPWTASMMAQASRDPLFRAALAVANQDAAFSGDLCLRCHTPNGWLDGRSTPTDGSLMSGLDLEGVNCNFCHRMVDPDHTPGHDPAVDFSILAALTDAPTTPHSGQFVIDPLDRRRGPFDLGSFSRHEWLQSPYHTSSSMCATCHDVSNPVFERQSDGSYLPGALGVEPASDNPYDQFPVERTYSEWAASAFAQAPIELGGRFGGNKTAVSTCQDCHMPDATGRGARNGDLRNDLPTHFLHGGNMWLLDAIRQLYPDSETYLSSAAVAAAQLRTTQFLGAASDTTAEQQGDALVVRVTNFTGHKLPTGYPEGRRMWLNVRFFDDDDQMIAERGAYDSDSATLSTADTKVYEAKLGISSEFAAMINRTAGESFHFALNNEWIKDNRIPPMGFMNSAFDAMQAAPVAYSYADGQHWDETSYTIPERTARAEITLYYQTASREYVEFLRDENTTDDTGQVLYNAWLANAMGPPVPTNSVSISIAPVVVCVGDIADDFGTLGGDGTVSFGDFLALLGLVGPCPGGTPGCDGDIADDFGTLGGDGMISFGDFLALLGLVGPCP